MTRDAAELFRKGKRDEASALIVKGQPLESQILGVPRPTLEAQVAASDLDMLYGRMLLSSRNYAWAQFLFQKDVARWKHWTPETEDTVRRLKLAEAAVAECDRGMAK
jgi:hypothetical protein